MNRIIKSFGIIVFVGAVVVGATGAFFSATVSSTGNVFTAGGVAINISEIEHNYQFTNENDLTGFVYADGSFSFNDLKPLDAGALEFSVNNEQNEVYLCGLITGTEVVGAADQALYENLNFFTGTEQVVPGNWMSFGTLDAVSGSYEFSVDYCFGDSDPSQSPLGCTIDSEFDYNLAQGGSFEADFLFYAIQTRNNEGFSCDQLSWDGQTVSNDLSNLEPLPSVGAVLGAYEVPESCDDTVTAGNSINDAIADAEDGQTICVEDGTYSGAVVIDKPLTLASVNGPTNTAILADGVKITASEVTVTGFNVIAGVVPGENNPVGFYVASGDDIEISSNLIDGAGAGQSSGVLTVTGGTYNNVVVENNVFENLTRGMYINPVSSGELAVSFNDFGSSNEVGIGGFNGAYVWRNEFRAPEGLGVDGSYDNNPTIVTENNFLEGSAINVYVSLTNNVDAPNNFFNLGGNIQTNGEIADKVDFLPEAGMQFPSL